MYEFFWFLGGAILYATLYRVLKIAKFYLFFNEIHLYILMMLEATSQYLEVANTIQSELLEDSDISEEEVKEIKLAGKQMILVWKETAVHKVKNCLPPAFKHSVKYQSWDSMINYLNKQTEMKK